MGESFLGLPNRFKVINNLLETTYNPNHVLSAYQGYRLSTDYLKRTGGKEYKMEGSLHTCVLLPVANNSYDIGSKDFQYRTIYAQSVNASSLYGNASSASKLEKARTISLTGSVTGSVDADFSGNVTINTTTNHNHDESYLSLTGGTLNGPLYTCVILPVTDSSYNIGSDTRKFKNVYASEFHGNLIGNANTSTKLKTPRTITVRLDPSTKGTDYDYGSVAFDGTSDVQINVKASYLPLSGGTNYPMSGDVYTKNILPIVGVSYTSSGMTGYSLGSTTNRFKELYAELLYGNSFSGNAASSTKLATSRKIKITLDQTDEPELPSWSSVDFDGSSDVSMTIWAPFLSPAGGTLSGNILPKTNDQIYLGDASAKFKGVYATNFFGNATSAAKLTEARDITVGNSTKTFDGSGNLSFSLSEIGAADASAVGVSSDFLTEYGTYTASGSNMIGDVSSLSLKGSLSTVVTLPAGTYVIISRIYGSALLPRSISIGIAYGSNPTSADDHSCVTIPSCPVVVLSDGTVKKRDKAFPHRVQSASIQQFSSTTIVRPYAVIEPSPNWDNTNFFDYSLSIRYVRIK